MKSVKHIFLLLFGVLFIATCRSAVTKIDDDRKVKDGENLSQQKDMDKEEGDKSSEISKSRVEVLGGGVVAGGSKKQVIKASGLKAGFADDNKQFNYYLQFLDQYGPRVAHIPVAIQERVIFKINDLADKPVPNAWVKIYNGSTVLTQGRTYPDGTFLFFPSFYSGLNKNLEAEITAEGATARMDFRRDGRREVNVRLNIRRRIPERIPLDIVFILDATGSMGEEIRQLKNSIEVINLNIAALSSKPSVRFGLVAYRDRGDEYVTKVIKLTEDLESFQNQLDKIEAGGGGDEPEDLQSALQDAITKMDWNDHGVRLAFILTDAPPQLYKDQNYTYITAAIEAKSKAIKIFSIGCGGLDLRGELVLRQIAQLTLGKYIFLTYGEKGESDGGQIGSVSHHTGANYQTDKLEALIIRFVKDELQYLSDKPIELAEEYFEALQVDWEKSEETVLKIMSMGITQLVDYSSERIQEPLPAAVIQLIPADTVSGMAKEVDYFTHHLIMALSRDKNFKLVERQYIETVLKEQDLQLSDLVDEKTCVQIGRLAGAKVLLMGNLFHKSNHYEIFLKMIKVETAEVLSVTKLKLDKRLGTLSQK